MFYHYLECLVMDYLDQYSYDELSQGYLPRVCRHSSLP